jgi:hypothetical protein
MEPVLIDQSHDYSWPNNWINDDQIEQLKLVFTHCFKGISPDDYYHKYFVSGDVFKRSLRLFIANGKIVGYCLLTFEAILFKESKSKESKSKESKNKRLKREVIMRASAGFYREYRQGGHTLSFSMKEAFKYWLTHPWQNIYYADTMLSPAMYRAITKGAAMSYPSQKNRTTAADLFERFNSNGLISDYTQTRCLVDSGRSTDYSEQEFAAFAKSNKPEIQFYRNANPDFASGQALFVIIPLNLKQLVLTTYKRFCG